MQKSILRRLYDRRVAIFLTVFLVAFVAVPFMAMAATDNNNNNNNTDPDQATASVPWENALSRLIQALTGKTALYISMIGLFFAGGILIFGGEIGSFTRMVMMVVLVGSMLTGVANLIMKFVK